MSIKIILRELTLSCSIGTDAVEHHVRQQLLLDADIKLKAPPSVDDAASYNYYTAVVALRQLAQAQHYGLMETFAAAAATVLLQNPEAQEVRVYVRKPKVFADLAEAGVEIIRTPDS